MEALWSVLGGVVVFAMIVLIWSKLIVKSWTLDSLEMLPAEEILFEEDQVDVHQVGGQRPTVFLSCKIRITNRRLIVAQKALLSPKMILRALIDYRDASGSGTDLKASMRSACIVASIPPSVMSDQRDGEQGVLEIPLGGGMLTRHQALHVHSRRIGEILALLRAQAGQSPK